MTESLFLTMEALCGNPAGMSWTNSTPHPESLRRGQPESIWYGDVMKTYWVMLAGCILAVIFGPLQAAAFQATNPQSGYAAEQCVGYNRLPPDSFSLVNNCDWPIEIAICADESGQACASPDRFTRHLIDGKAQLPGTFRALQSLNIFACKSPAVVTLRPDGLGSCDPSGTANLPLLLSSSLKNAASIITASDYPAGVKAEGNTRFEMRVGADGKPLSCFITLSSGKDALDRATCNAFMKRARFSPAKNASGKTIEGRYRGNVTWKEQ